MRDYLPDSGDDDEPYLTVNESRAFQRHVKGLNKLIIQIRERYPEAQYYLACSMGARLHILSGSSHDDDYNPRARQDRIIETETLKWADGGDW